MINKFYYFWLLLTAKQNAISYDKRRKSALLYLFIATAMLIAIVTAQPAQAQTDPTGPFRISNYGSGKCVEVAPEQRTGSLFENGNRIWQRTCDGSPQQSWILVAQGSSFEAPYAIHIQPRYYIVNQYTGKCLDLRDGRTADGAAMQQWDCSASTTLMWGLFDDFSLYPSRQLVNQRSLKCLDVESGSLQDYAWLQNYRCTHGNTAQHFYLF